MGQLQPGRKCPGSTGPKLVSLAGVPEISGRGTCSNLSKKNIRHFWLKGGGIASPGFSGQRVDLKSTLWEGPEISRPFSLYEFRSTVIVRISGEGKHKNEIFGFALFALLRPLWRVLGRGGIRIPGRGQGRFCGLLAAVAGDFGQFFNALDGFLLTDTV